MMEQMTGEKREDRSRRRVLARRRRRRRVLLGRLVVGCLVVLCGVGGLGCLMAGGVSADGRKGNGERTEERNGVRGELRSGGNADGGNVDAGKEEGEIVGEAVDLYEKWKDLLVLVNKENPLGAGYDPELCGICEGRVEIQECVYDDLVEMLEAAEEEGYSYWIASGYRSRRKQEELMEQEIQKNMALGLDREAAHEKSLRTLMEPGYSEHETGLALDLLCSENPVMDVHQEEEAGNRWLCAHAHEYGFVLRYPSDKVQETQINFEPWHFRYVGREVAAFLWEQDLCLEEFCRMAGAI